MWLTPAGDSLQDAKLETSNRPECEIRAPPVAGNRVQPCHFSQVVVHHANVADLAAGRVGHEHEDQKNNEDDDCIARKGRQLGHKHDDQQDNEDDDCIARKWCQAFAAGRIGHKHENQQNHEDDDCIARKKCQGFTAGCVGHQLEDQQNNEGDDCTARQWCLASASHDADTDAPLLIHS